MQRVADLPHWPPDASGIIPSRTRVSGVSPEQVAIKDVERVVGNHIDFTGTFAETVVKYGFNTPDVKTANKLAALLRQNKEVCVFSIGVLEIPADA
jgi:hypothetical protein